MMVGKAVMAGLRRVRRHLVRDTFACRGWPNGRRREAVCYSDYLIVTCGLAGLAAWRSLFLGALLPGSRVRTGRLLIDRFLINSKLSNDFLAHSRR